MKSLLLGAVPFGVATGLFLWPVLVEVEARELAVLDDEEGPDGCWKKMGVSWGAGVVLAPLIVFSPKGFAAPEGFENGSEEEEWAQGPVAEASTGLAGLLLVPSSLPVKGVGVVFEVSASVPV